jgi:hexokinase
VEDIKKKVIAFLKKYQMDYEDIDMEATCGVFLDEMAKGLAGEESSLKMLPTYIETGVKLPPNEPVIALDAGGTNFRVATITFDKDGNAHIEPENPAPCPMPGVEKKASKEEFFAAIAGYVKDVLHKSTRIGFCFSYPIEIFPNKDGKLLYFSKEIKAKEVEGQMVGENLLAAFKALGHKDAKHIVLLNDTVTTLLAGIASFPGRSFDSYVGFILGTGTNCCYIEQNINITKTKDLDPAKSQIVNVESGGFAKAPRGQIDLLFDSATLNPGIYTFEKMISGAYLGPVCLKAAHVAAKDGLFSKAIADKLTAIDRIDTKDISDFMYYPRAHGNTITSACKGASDHDLAALYFLFDRLIERAAKLTAINLSSVVIKSGKGQNPCFPVCIVAEGTTFYECKSLKAKTEHYLKSYLQEQRQRYYEIVAVDNATLIGAAIAGLTN